jgi:ribonuclease R
MLPEQLSNGLCSLNPHVDRLAMVCEMTISKAGEMTDYCFYEAVIHSHARLTYNKVSAMLETPKATEARKLRGEYTDVVPHLKQLYALYKVLLAARHVRGAIDFPRKPGSSSVPSARSRKFARPCATMRTS